MLILPVNEEKCNLRMKEILYYAIILGSEWRSRILNISVFLCN